MKNWKEIAINIVGDEYNNYLKSIPKGGDGRRPDSVTYSDINGDAQRRDLTINALYYDIKTKEIIDLVGGVEDIKNGVVRTVGAADERFEEDRLRILRAIRFTARVGSVLDPAIDKSIRNNNSLDLLAAEAIMEEFKKGISSSKSTRQYLSLLDKYGLFKWILKGVGSFNHKFVESNDLIVVFASLLINLNSEEASNKMKALEYTNDEANSVKLLIELYATPLNEETFIPLKIVHDKLQSKGALKDDTFKEFISIMDMDMNLYYKFMEYDFNAINFAYVKANDIRDKEGNPLGPGEELGNKIKELKTKDFFGNK